MTSREDKRQRRDAIISDMCQSMVGQAPDKIGAPGGDSRDSMRAYFGEQSLIVSRRKQEQRARLEALVLKALNESSAPVPRLIAWRGQWLLQQDLGAQRLSEALDQAAEPEVGGILQQAVTSLVQCQRAGREKGLHQHLVSLGEKRPWFDKLLARRHGVGELLGIEAPELDEDALAHQLRLRDPHFLKRDARPGNAIATGDGDVFWIDWEHCGCRNPLDDLVWLMADEYTPDNAAAEALIMSTWLEPLSTGWDSGEAEDYFYTYAVLHSLVRLHYILRYREDGPWWDYQYCLSHDKVGVTRAQALRQLRRMQRWVGNTSHLGGLESWLAQLEQALPVN